jgi:hypothetical protein
MEKSIMDKYAKIRHLVKQGDLILFHGHSAVSRIIQEADDDAYWNHIGVVGEIAKSLFIIDSNAFGVKPERLSSRIRKYENGDFMVIRSLQTRKEINLSLEELLKYSDINEVKYDFKNGIKSLLNRWLKTKFKIKEDKNYKICSMFTYPHEVRTDIMFPVDTEKSLVFPEDTIRFGKSYSVIVDKNFIN